MQFNTVQESEFSVYLYSFSSTSNLQIRTSYYFIILLIHPSIHPFIQIVLSTLRTQLFFGFYSLLFKIIGFKPEKYAMLNISTKMVGDRILGRVSPSAQGSRCGNQIGTVLDRITCPQRYPHHNPRFCEYMMSKTKLFRCD